MGLPRCFSHCTCLGNISEEMIPGRPLGINWTSCHCMIWTSKAKGFQACSMASAKRAVQIITSICLGNQESPINSDSGRFRMTQFPFLSGYKIFSFLFLLLHSSSPLSVPLCDVEAPLQHCKSSGTVISSFSSTDLQAPVKCAGLNLQTGVSGPDS